MRRTITVMAIMGLLLVGTGQSVQADTLFDGFDTEISSGLWEIRTDGPGVAWTVDAPGELRIAKAADPGGVNDTIAGGVTSKFALVGDFELTVDYQLVTWPDAGEGYNFARIFLDQPGDDWWLFLLGRHGQKSIEATHFRNKTHGLIGTPGADNSLSGTFGLERVGNAVSAWVDHGSGSMSCGSYVDPTLVGPLTVELLAGQGIRPTGYRSFSALDVRYDNLTITADTIVPEPGTVLLVTSGLLGLVGLIRRHRK